MLTHPGVLAGATLVVLALAVILYGIAGIILLTRLARGVAVFGG